LVTSTYRGHIIYHDDFRWRYVDDNEPVKGIGRPCVRCGNMATPEGYDACLGYIPGALSACCGH